MSTTQRDTAVLHACVSRGEVYIWGESASAFLAADKSPQIDPDAVVAHPFAISAERLLDLIPNSRKLGLEPGAVDLRLPGIAGDGPGRTLPSDQLSHELGRESHEPDQQLTLETRRLEALCVPLGVFSETFDAILERPEQASVREHDIVTGDSIAFLAALGVLAKHLLAQQRFVPMLFQDDGHLTGGWMPWLGDAATADRVRAIAALMPPSVRAAVDETGHDSWAIIQSVLNGVTDAACRRTLLAEQMIDVIEGRDGSDVQVAWLCGLLGEDNTVPAGDDVCTDMARRVRRWVGSLEDRGQSTSWRLLFRLNEPLEEMLEGVDGPPPDSVQWSLSLHLQNLDDESVVIDAVDIWAFSRDSVSIRGLLLESPQELLLAELGRASRFCSQLERALDESEPIEVLLSTQEAYTFLREIKPVLIESGFGVETPLWWDTPAGRLGARLKITSDPMDAMMENTGADASTPRLGLTALVGYQWDIAVGGATLSLHEFEQLAAKKAPLVRIDGRWIEIRPEDVEAAVEFIRANPGGEMPLGEALRLAFGADSKKIGLHVIGVEASGWVSSILGGDQDETVRAKLPDIQPPETFHGTLRPYQQRGLSWMAFLEQFGFGACLADDMGLGKTIQLLALLTYEREEAAKAGGTVEPTLLVVPMSVVGNWLKETKRFAPSLEVLVHHGLERLSGEALIEAAQKHDTVITTFALAHRDREILARVKWGRIVVDEAQFIKNPAAKQSLAVRSFVADRRVALTGTPVENRLSELWSIMEFLNPGFLGTGSDFRKRFSQPIERYGDKTRSEQLRGLVRPFILRRIKTDPMVAADLPEKIETREYCHLTSEQAELYESCVNRMLSAVDESEGIHRRGLVLAALIKLKQICNHPAQYLKDLDTARGAPGSAPNPLRSGKCTRMLEMIDEVLAEGERSLIFTQFRQMGHLLAAMLRHELGREVLFLHGGSPQKAREKMVEQFQDPNADSPILLVSLKAGGVGLNLTAATHVFHFDRWWNPAVENQATDRAYRIGQTRTVHVHKFVVRGTLEERIDEMIEAKTELAENIIGAGERWLTDLDTGQLREILTLRSDAIGYEP